jgi:hypothetical protein
MIGYGRKKVEHRENVPSRKGMNHEGHHARYLEDLRDGKYGSN